MGRVVYVPICVTESKPTTDGAPKQYLVMEIPVVLGES